MYLVVTIILLLCVIWWQDRVCTLKQEMRMLWQDNTWWTREYLISVVAKSPSSLVIEKKLYKIQSRLADLFEMYYGDEFAIQPLFESHINYIVLWANGDASAKDNLYKTSTEMSQMFRKKSIIGEHLKDYLDLTIQQFSEIGDGATIHVHTYDKLSQLALTIADIFAWEIASRPWMLIR